MKGVDAACMSSLESGRMKGALESGRMGNAKTEYALVVRVCVA